MKSEGSSCGTCLKCGHARRTNETATGCRVPSAFVTSQKWLHHAADVDWLNTTVVTPLKLQLHQFNTCAVRTNKLRHVTVYKLKDLRVPEARKYLSFQHGTHVDKLLEVQDSSDVKGPGLLLYTQDIDTHGCAFKYLHSSENRQRCAG